MSRSRQLAVLLLLVAVAAAAGLLLLRLRDGGSAGATAGVDGAGTGTAGARTLADARHADFVSIFVYDASGGVSSFMVGGRTDEFRQFADAIADARPVEPVGGSAAARTSTQAAAPPGQAAAQTSDDSFSDLLVLSFGPQDTMEIPYSRTRNLLSFGDQDYQPAADLAPLIGAVEKKFNDGSGGQ